MRFTGLQPFGQVSGLIDITVDHFGDVDLRNEAYVSEIRFLSRESSMSIIVDFHLENRGDERLVSLEFADVEIVKIDTYMSNGIDPIYGHALLFGIGHWVNQENSREGFTLSMTTFVVEFYATELAAKMRETLD